MWDEFESIIPFSGRDCERSRQFVVFLHQQKLMKFLIGLNETYAPQRSQILMRHPTPTLDQAYSMIIQEESQRMSYRSATQNGILGGVPLGIDISALVTVKASNMRPSRNTILICDYCKMKGHTRDTCYKLNGYPPGFKSNNNKKRETQNNSGPTTYNVNGGDEFQNARNGYDMQNVSIVPTVQAFTPEQFQQILKLLSKEPQPEEVANMASISLTEQSCWIIDSGASNHMES
ncbi:uncharacterized protein LOC142162669 [Nicotiana tabacum]|uniref:Uncharacterized protein LOC142162669 n=1 Tax=Nicotiana tabacum TaxID=4097 RepID=A0AC58RRC2_TOBAC